MSRIDRHVLHLARFTLEARTALSIGTGGPDGVFDHPIVRDANGLPMIPGTSLAGVLRHLWPGGDGLPTANEIFGYQHRDDGAASRLQVATCCLQDSQGRPVEGLALGTDAARLTSDFILKAALETQADPLYRDRVRLSHRGVAHDRGKFDRGILAAGHRFSGELRLWSGTKNDPAWDCLLDLLADPRLRLGGATRAGLGAMTLVALYTVSLDLCNPAEIGRFRGLKPGLGDLDGLTERDPHTLGRQTPGVQTLKIRLTPRDFWRFGQGDSPVARHDKDPDLLPKREPVLRWENGRATPAVSLALIPGSSVKGALAHRTAFHWNVLNDKFVEELTPEALAAWDKSEDCEKARQVFGHAKDRDPGGAGRRHGTGQAGHLIFEDAQLRVTAADAQAMIHNSLDRFTGGVRDRLLFAEELIWRKPIDLAITLLPGLDGAEPSARRALARALKDLCQGRLALGAGTTKGHGSFTGAPDTATRAWLAAQGEPLEPTPEDRT